MSTRPRGFAAISSTIIIVIVLVAGATLLSYVVSVTRTEKRVAQEFTSVQAADAGIQKAIYCLNAAEGSSCGGTYGNGYTGESDVPIGDATFTVTVDGDALTRSVTSVGMSVSGVTSTIKVDMTKIPPSDDMDFTYALQAGSGGARLDNNAVISGSIYANGDIDCQTTAATIDGDAYVAKEGGHVDGCTINYHAHADNVLNNEVGGDAYYDLDPSGIAGSTVTGSLYPGSATPEPGTLPDPDISFWKSSASAGPTYTGEYHPADGEEMGPFKVVGDLVMDNNVDVVITGPIWVQGDIITGNNTSFSLHSDFGQYSTVIMAHDPNLPDTKGKITIQNGTGIYGSGNPQSHLAFISTNTSTDDAAPALEVANNSSGAVFLAVAGTLKVAQNGGAKSLAAYRLYVSENAFIDYVESEMSDTNFSNSPGTSWYVQEGTWRQIK